MMNSAGGVVEKMGKWYERIKFALLTVSFSFVVAAYTIAKELKDSVFMNIVGREYIAKAKLFVIFFLIPAVFLYSYLVDKFRRYQLLAFYCYLYGITLLICAFLLGSPSIGLYNTDTTPWRVFGWFFYFLIEGFSPFVVGVFWAFVNSITSPKEAQNHYATMVAGSKVGGMLAAVFAWYLLSHISLLGYLGVTANGVVAHQLLLGLVALLLLFVPGLVRLMMKYVPGSFLHGYKAVYKAEKAKGKSTGEVAGIISGLKVLINSPYIFGIFGLVFFYESLNVILNIQRLFLLANEANGKMAGFTASLFEQRFWMHAVGFVLSLLGTRILMKKFGERVSLIAVPVLISMLLIYFLIFQTPQAMLNVFIGLGAVNYSFSHPLRESLYIPTLKDMKFKAKSWIDTFGTKLSKASGSIFSDFTASLIPGTSMFLFAYGSFFAILMGLWFAVAYLLGKRYESAVSKNEIIQ